MRLKYIEIQGFKSFPDKTKLKFEKGLTGIVGPNGSGKSNISDAVRWVLGEQSTKSLRGGKMEDVIFGGTQLRKAMGFAQVSLCLDNTDGRIAESGDEVVVSRRYYRSGDSEYLLNGAAVRLKDVRETFLDTGLGRDGYSIIGQGRIAEVVNAKSEERREIFEEASGIAKYRYRKNEAEHKLEAAEDNLSRLRDILDELNSRIGPLKEQSEKARKFLELSEEKRSLEITLYCDTIERSRDNLRAQDDKLTIAKRDYDSVQEQLAALDQRVDDVYKLNNKLSADIDAYNAEIVRASENATKLESDAAVFNNDIAHGDEQMRSLEEELSLLSGDGNAVLEEIKQKQLAAETRRAEIEALDRLIAEAERELSELVESDMISDQKKQAAVKKLNELQAEITDLRVAGVAAASAVESFNEREKNLAEQMKLYEGHIASAEKEKQDNEKYLETLKTDMTECQNRVNGFAMKLQSRDKRLTELDGILRKKEYEIAENEHRISAMRDMDKSMDGYAPGVRRVIEEKERRALKGIVGTVASLITIDAGCELAIETALGAAIQNIVVEDETSAKQAIAFLKQTKAGRATFLPLDTIKPSKFDDGDALIGDGIVGLASSLVKCDKRYNAVISSLLGRVAVTEDLDAASLLARKLRYRYRIVTMDGQIINAGGSYTGGFASRSAGIFSRKNEIEKLEKRVAEIEQSSEGERKQAEELRREISGLDAEITALNSDLSTNNEDRIRVESALAATNRELDTAREALERCASELEGIKSSRDEKTALSAKNEGLAATLSQEAERLERSLGDSDESGDALMKRRSELTAALSERRIERVGKEKDIENIGAFIEQLTQKGSASAERAAAIDRSIAEIKQRNAERLAEIEKYTSGAAELRESMALRRADIENAVKRRGENEKLITELRASSSDVIQQREDLGRETARLEERKEALRADYDRYIARLWEEYELTRAEALSLCVPFESITELRGKVAELRGKIKSLGSVNVAAIEEYKEVAERHGFLTEQVGDVERSKTELLKLIEELETEMRAIFTKKFNEINNEFRRVFVELFGGGSANLSLSDENDVLGSGIELDVQPPGKVIKNLSALSGGEQSLVAIAIYFSILRVNPSPFCILDEIDSALDEANVARFASYLKKSTDETQIITITHRRGTMESADELYGVTMQEEGVSKLLKLNVEEAQLVVSQ